MQNEIVIDQTQRKIVNHILKKHLSTDIEVWVFGSRATNKAKPFSDLDLVFRRKQDSNTRIDLQLLAKLENDFDESELPWKVEIIDYDSVDENFRKIIDRDKKEFSIDRGLNE